MAVETQLVSSLFKSLHFVLARVVKSTRRFNLTLSVPTAPRTGESTGTHATMTLDGTLTTTDQTGGSNSKSISRRITRLARWRTLQSLLKMRRQRGERISQFSTSVYMTLRITCASDVM